ncbi:formimidoylglutamate deiminase [Labedella populi]|uniref:Formimidoylglutamate deiminase n=1 Tax=Labedella populi TaxID=2498850 RepID=A0A3S3ZWS1_9MICO|nr:formimidoylglutamate deiminase [Labedella populi]RWZ68340.1 formimidoylglutamate deiminase [Labedella populi]
MTRYWATAARLPDGFASDVLIASDERGAIAAVTVGVERPTDAVTLGTVVPGFANAHSHAFHRLLRGRTHDGSGDFWRWRTAMYEEARRLTPDRYRRVATAVFAEMAAAGYTSVGEFHYVHHRPDGSPYPRHDMENAIADAAEEVGIRLVLLDTCYLTGGIGRPLEGDQVRFGDGSAARWLDRWSAVRDALTARSSGLVTLGAAVHSVRAVPVEELAVVAGGLPQDVPLHVHLSEQPAENAESLSATGATPSRLLADAGLLSRRLSAVHATHLTDDDIALLGGAGATIVMCPTTEADLGDGIGPARRLADAGSPIAIGSDQNAVIDPFAEVRGLEYGERLASGSRGRFAPDELWRAGTRDGYVSLGLDGGEIRSGAWCDLVEIAADSVRTLGSDHEQLPYSATAADVTTVIVGGRSVASRDSDALAHLLGLSPTTAVPSTNG